MLLPRRGEVLGIVQNNGCKWDQTKVLRLRVVLEAWPELQ